MHAVAEATHINLNPQAGTTQTSGNEQIYLVWGGFQIIPSVIRIPFLARDLRRPCSDFERPVVAELARAVTSSAMWGKVALSSVCECCPAVSTSFGPQSKRTIHCSICHIINKAAVHCGICKQKLAFCRTRVGIFFAHMLVEHLG